MVHTNSLSSYIGLLDDGTKETRQRMVLEYLKAEKKPLTAKQIMKGLKFNDLNQVRPRITELKQAGKIVELGNQYDEESRRSVAVFGVA